MINEALCSFCNSAFRKRKANSTYCSIDCRKKAYLKRTGKDARLGLPTGTIGAISELIVFTDLLRKGYEAYRPLTANCSGDILIDKEGKFIKIEVRTGYRHKTSDNLTYSPHFIRSDIIAVVILQNNEIIYLDSKTRNKVSI